MGKGELLGGLEQLASAFVSSDPLRGEAHSINSVRVKDREDVAVGDISRLPIVGLSVTRTLDLPPVDNGDTGVARSQERRPNVRQIVVRTNDDN